MSNKILVTGATGNIGYYVVGELSKLGEQVKAAVQNVKDHKDTYSKFKCVEVVPFNFLDSTTYDEALQGVDRVFLVRPPQLANPEKDMKPFLTAIKQRGIKQVLFVSLMGVEKNPVVPHRKIENMIQTLGLPYTFLRPSFFMQNLNTTHQEEIKYRNEIFVPVGKAKTSFIDTRDIGSAAAICLTEHEHVGKAYTLTGAEAIDYFQAAKIMTDVLGRNITYKNPGVFAFRRETIKRGAKKEFANVMTMLYLLTRLRTAEKVTDDLKMLLKRNPISFEQYVADYQKYWK